MVLISNADAIANAVAKKMSESDSATLQTSLSEMFEEKGVLSASEKSDINSLFLSVGQLKEILTNFRHHGITKENLRTALKGVQRELQPDGV